MSRTYTIRSADGQRSYGTVTKETAKGMVKRGEAKFLNCNAVQLMPPSQPMNPAPLPEKKRNPISKDFRGLSASPSAGLSHRYVQAKKLGGDDEAIAALEGCGGVVGWSGGRN